MHRVGSKSNNFKAIPDPPIEKRITRGALHTFRRSYGNLWAYSEGENGVRVETLQDWIVFSKDVPAFFELLLARQRVLHPWGELGTRYTLFPSFSSIF